MRLFSAKGMYGGVPLAPPPGVWDSTDSSESTQVDEHANEDATEFKNVFEKENEERISGLWFV